MVFFDECQAEYEFGLSFYKLPFLFLSHLLNYFVLLKTHHKDEVLYLSLQTWRNLIKKLIKLILLVFGHLGSEEVLLDLVLAIEGEVYVLHYSIGSINLLLLLSRLPCQSLLKYGNLGEEQREGKSGKQ